jgi:hypothetical protein
MKKLTLRDKSILAGLYLSKFDLDGLKKLGFDSFTEAFNVIGLALGTQPASIKNYRDEFDPLFPNERKGWHKRETRKYCKDIYDTFHSLNIHDFSHLLKEIIYENHNLDVLMEDVEKSEKGGEESTFAKRLITGQAAEHYFKSAFQNVELFKGYSLEDTTKYGCGFDFKLTGEDKDKFIGVEVKGLNEQYGNIILTNKEHAVADILKERYFIFVVRNFREKPFHSIHQNPIKNMAFNRNVNRIVQISWSTSV